MTMILGLQSAKDGPMRPMTAQFEHDHGPIY
jgi:hypothetical protein